MKTESIHIVQQLLIVYNPRSVAETTRTKRGDERLSFQCKRVLNFLAKLKRASTTMPNTTTYTLEQFNEYINEYLNQQEEEHKRRLNLWNEELKLPDSNILYDEYRDKLVQFYNKLFPFLPQNFFIKMTDNPEERREDYEPLRTSRGKPT